MATLLDFGLLKPFEAIFPFLFLMVFLYAVLSRFKIFEDKPAFSAIIAFALSIMGMMSSILVRTINLMAPWLVLLIIFIVMVLLAYQAFGIEEGTIIDIITGEKYGETFSWTVIVIVTIIFLGSLTSAISEQHGFQRLQAGGISPEKLGEPGSEREDFFRTIFHPKVLGIVLLMLIALVTIQRISSES